MALTLFEIDLPPVKRRVARFLSPSRRCSLKDTLNEFVPFELVNDDSILVSCCGRVQDLSTDCTVPGTVYHVSGKLLGGKGGFGSLLRAIGMQIEKTKNKEACRDLSGRRMRDINNEKKLKEWFSKAADRMMEKEQRKRQRRERLLQEPKHLFDDQEYMKQKEEVMDEMESALQAGMEKARKRAQRQAKIASENDGGPSKKLKSIDAWAGVDISQLSSSSDSEDSSTSSNLSDLPPPELELSEDDETSTSKEKEVEEGNGKKKEAKTEEKKEEPAEPPKVEQVFDPIDLDKVESLNDLEKFGLDHLKAELRRRNMKCGGTLQERARRLWEVKCPPAPVQQLSHEKPSKKKTKSK